MFKRPIKQTIPLQDRLALFAIEVREKASLLPPGAEKEELDARAQRAEIACHNILDWINSPGLQPPK
jgi:hypothetical protein